MNIADHSLRVATLSAMAWLVAQEYKTARKEAEAAYQANGIKKLAIALPGGDLVGDITVTQPSPKVDIDEEQLLQWVAEHTPAEVEEYLDPTALTDQELIEWARQHREDLLKRRVRSVWREELQKTVTANGGYVVDPQTGESQKVAEVTPRRATGAFSLSQDPRGERAKRILRALRAGELAGITNLAISAPDEADEAA